MSSEITRAEADGVVSHATSRRKPCRQHREDGSQQAVKVR
jgi:hypothetical protein